MLSLKIEFRRTQKAYLPEIDVYKSVFKKFGFETMESFGDEVNSNTDIVWQFMGFAKPFKNKVNIHEYVSLSTGRFPYLKNKVKKHLASLPNGRLFLNEFVKNEFAFSDDISHLCRDMGVDKRFFNLTKNQGRKQYEFIYAGSICKARQIDKLCRAFVSKLPGRKLSLIGEPELEIYKEFSGNPCIEFLGYVPYKELPGLYKDAGYGVNYCPPVYPYHYQTSTKVLEYYAAGLKVISSDNQWIREFNSKRKGHCYYLKKDLSNMKEDCIESFSYHNPDVSDLEWEIMLHRIGIEKWLKKIVENEGR